LLKATTGARDLEVGIDLLKQWEKQGPARVKSSAEKARRLVESSSRREKKKAAHSLDTLRNRVDKLPRRLNRFLSHSPKEMTDIPLVSLLNSVIHDELDQFESRWRQAKRSKQPDDLHRLRVAGKRARYLLEPLRENYPEAAAMVGKFKKIQQDLGDWHDLQVMEETLEKFSDESKELARSLKPVLTYCRQQRRQSLQRITKHWLRRAPIQPILLS